MARLLGHDIASSEDLEVYKKETEIKIQKLITTTRRLKYYCAALLGAIIIIVAHIR